MKSFSRSISWTGRSALVLFLSVSTLALAAKVEPKGNAFDVIKSGGIEIPVYREVTLRTADGTDAVPLYLTGAGIRRKNLVLDFDVYSAVSYISTNPSTIDPKQETAKILAAVRESKAKVLEMTMLTDLSAREIRSAFKSALKLNEVNVEKPAIDGLLSGIKFSFPTSKKVYIVGYAKDAATDVVEVLMDGQEPLKAEAAGLSQDFWNVWFAKTGDKHMATLQAQLISQITK